MHHEPYTVTPRFKPPKTHLKKKKHCQLRLPAPPQKNIQLQPAKVTKEGHPTLTTT